MYEIFTCIDRKERILIHLKFIVYLYSVLLLNLTNSLPTEFNKRINLRLVIKNPLRFIKINNVLYTIFHRIFLIKKYFLIYKF